MHWEPTAPWPARAVAAYVILLVGWWCHVGARARLGDAPGDRAWPRPVPQPRFAAGLAVLISLQVSMVVLWWRSFEDREVLRAPEVAGVLAVACGAGLRWWAMAALGRYYTHQIGLRRGHVLVTAGPYARLRHPGYVGTILVACGTAAFFGPSIPGLVYAVVTTWLLVARMPVEDEMLARSLGPRRASARAGRWPFRPHGAILRARRAAVRVAPRGPADVQRAPDPPPDETPP